MGGLWLLVIGSMWGDGELEVVEDDILVHVESPVLGWDSLLEQVSFFQSLGSDI
jgi:hypothetical protein